MPTKMPLKGKRRRGGRRKILREGVISKFYVSNTTP
jgi:hypothetical protein